MRTILGAFAILSLCIAPLRGQETNQAHQMQQIQQQLRQLQDAFEKEQQLHRQQLEALQKQLDLLQLSQSKTTQTVATSIASLGTNAPPSPLPESKKPWSPTGPITLLGGQKSYMNMSLDALMAAGSSTGKDSDIGHLQLGGHDPKERGFTIQNLEMVLDGAVDPYFRGQANLIYQVDSAGESTFELEEAYAETTALPGNFQIKAGQYVTEFGRLNPTHPHTWAFVDQPLVNGRFFGGDGLRSQGARISWLAPTPFYSELFLGIQNSQGETAYSFRNAHPDGMLFGRPAVERSTHSFGDMLFTPRYAASFDLSPSQTALVGASAAFGPNSSGADTATQIYGVDLFWKWKPVSHNGGFPFVSWQTEGMWRRYGAGAYDGTDPAQPLALPAETLTDYGAYSQLSWGFRKGWIAALRGDWVSADHTAYYPDPDRDQRWRISPNLTWHPTEFSKLRLQYNNDHRENIGVDHSGVYDAKVTFKARQRAGKGGNWNY